MYRLIREKYAYDLNSASGQRGRWNDDGQHVLYTAESRALACLENLVHRSNSGDNSIFRVMIIHIPDDLEIKSINKSDLPTNWKQSFCKECLSVGSNWYIHNDTVVLKVPSSIIPEEWNFILNTRHPEFKRV